LTFELNNLCIVESGLCDTGTKATDVLVLKVHGTVPAAYQINLTVTGT
jgi:hypothetical protein